MRLAFLRDSAYTRAMNPYRSGLLLKLYGLLLRFNAEIPGLPPVTGVDRDMDALDKLTTRLIKESE